VLTRRGGELRLYLNGNLQFSSRDEYRYHEALVWPVLGRVATPRHVLILGGGDGLAAREVLKDKSVQHIDLVDLDPEMTHVPPHAATGGAQSGIADQPAPDRHQCRCLPLGEAGTGPYDAVIVDFPDPTEYSLGKLYTESFYREVSRLLAPDGVMVVQSTSPLVAPRSYWTVASTLEASGLSARGYHVYVPSFGEWGYTLAAHDPARVASAAVLPAGLKFLTPPPKGLCSISPRYGPPRDPVNRLDNQALVRSFSEEWSHYEG
jgi:spermidine synthase